MSLLDQNCTSTKSPLMLPEYTHIGLNIESNTQTNNITIFCLMSRKYFCYLLFNIYYYLILEQYVLITVI